MKKQKKKKFVKVKIIILFNFTNFFPHYIIYYFDITNFFKQNILCLSFQVGKGKCGGVLVDRRHVVTAGHCVKNKVLSSIAVTLGEYHLKSSREPLPSQSYRYFSMFCNIKATIGSFFYSEFNIFFLPFFPRFYRVVMAVVHPKFQFSPAADRFDVAVLRLERPVRYAPHIAPICLPEVCISRYF